jgi:hypothetical protein
MSIQRCILVALTEAEALSRGLRNVTARPDAWTSLADVIPTEGAVLARINRQKVYLARRSFVEPEHPLYDAEFEWQPLP